MKISLLILAVTCFTHSYSQELVINGSFDDVNVCEEYKAKCSPSAWFYINDGPKGFQVREGYLSLNAVNVTNAKNKQETRQYWQTKLLCKTEFGKKYNVS